MKFQFRNINILVSVVFLIALTTSCISSKSLVIEIPVQSKKELPQSIQSLTLVNRTIDNSFSDLDSDSIQKIFYKQRFSLDTVINDIQASDTTIKALGELLFESGRYDFVIPENRFLTFEKNAFLTSEMKWDEVKELCDTFNTDAVLSLDHFRTRVSTNFEKESYYDPSADGFRVGSYAKMQIAYEALFRIYDPVQEKVLLREFVRDTIAWEDADFSTTELFQRFTPVKTGLSEAGIAIALDFSEMISTTWRSERRSFFIKGDNNLKHAAILIDKQDWDPAMALWIDTAENTKSKSVRSKAEFNIAVGYELMGDLEEAVFWGLKSYESMYRPVTYEYLEILKRRKNEIKKTQ